MQLQLRTFPAILLSVAVLVLSACGGSDDPDPSSADVPAGSVSDPDAAKTDEPTKSAEPTEEAPSDGSEWVAITDEPSEITFAMPEATEPQVNSANVGEGTSVDLRNYSTMIEGEIELGFNVIDTPGADYDFDAGIKGVASSLGGEVVSTTKTKAAGNPAVDVEMTYDEDYIVFFQLVTGKEHIVQSLASGPKSERAVVHETYRQLSDSVAGY